MIKRILTVVKIFCTYRSVLKRNPHFELEGLNYFKILINGGMDLEKVKEMLNLSPEKKEIDEKKLIKKFKSMNKLSEVCTSLQ